MLAFFLYLHTLKRVIYYGTGLVQHIQVSNFTVLAKTTKDESYMVALDAYNKI